VGRARLHEEEEEEEGMVVELIILR